jgi:hypothetical protein
MSDRSTGKRARHSLRAARQAFLLGIVSLTAVSWSAAAPADPKPAEERRVSVARGASPAGMLLQRQAADKPWQFPASGDAIYSRDQLLALPGARADVESANGAVVLTLAGNLPLLSTAPVLESAVVLHDHDAAVDLDLTLARGRIILTSSKDKEPARVRIRAQGEVWVLTLEEKGDQAAVEVYGRWQRGVPFSQKPRPDEKPVQALLLLALKGVASLKAGPEQYALRAPMQFHWDSISGADAGPQRMEKIPDWAEPSAGAAPSVKFVQNAEDRLREQLRAKPVDAALCSLLEPRSEAAAMRTAANQLAACGMGAVDDLTDLTKALANERDAELRDAAVGALRHWIGRGPGQDQQLYEHLIKEAKYSPTQAEIVLQLLHSPFQADQPETYETLILYLGSDNIAVRELAQWHLYRLAPAGKKIVYNAGAQAADRERAIKEWQKLIPDGKLPPKAAPEKDKK